MTKHYRVTFFINNKLAPTGVIHRFKDLFRPLLSMYDGIWNYFLLEEENY